MIIKVTQSHINRGNRCDARACPVALAITETTGYNVMVESSVIYVINHNFLEWATPEAVIEFINKFDNGEPVEPFEFELNVEGVG